jgi:hypothetical protein
MPHDANLKLKTSRNNHNLSLALAGRLRQGATHFYTYPLPTRFQ